MSESPRTGVWLIGAYGSIATCVVAGTEAMRAGLCSRRGLVTDLADFLELGLVEPEDLVFGGCDLREGDLVRSATEFSRQNGILTGETIAALRDRLLEISSRVRPGIAVNCGPAIEALAGPALRSNAKRTDLPGAIRAFQEDLQAFRETHRLERVVVVNIASTEPARDLLPEFERLEALEGLLKANRPAGIPPSVLYAYAALDAGCPFVNFTPSPGSNLPALDELARLRGIPHMGKDGKTGETLLKTTIAPMLLARNFRILSWEGHNLLGNRDGEVLNTPENNLAKIRDKDDVLRKMADDPAMHTRVRIDYVPSLGDWKTAWNFIHFQGFLDAKMMLQLLWHAADSALAAPLVLDLVRLADFARRRGESGAMPHLACFFKAPYRVTEHAFPAQMDRLLAYVREHRLKSIEAVRKA